MAILQMAPPLSSILQREYLALLRKAVLQMVILLTEGLKATLQKELPLMVLLPTREWRVAPQMATLQTEEPKVALQNLEVSKGSLLKEPPQRELKVHLEYQVVLQRDFPRFKRVPLGYQEYQVFQKKESRALLQILLQIPH